MSTEQRKEALVSFINAVPTNNINRICIFFCQKFFPWTPVPPIFVLKKKFETNLLRIERTGIWAGKRVTKVKNLLEQRSTVFFFRPKAGQSKQRRESTNCPYIWSRVPNQTWVRFSKGPKLFGRISGDIVLFVSSKRRRLRARNFTVILIFLPLTTHQKASFTEWASQRFRKGFSGPKSFRETDHGGLHWCKVCTGSRNSLGAFRVR